MTGTKWLIASTLVVVMALMAGGVYYPDALVMSMADTSLYFTLIRGVIVVLLLSLLLTKPPRSQALRLVIGLWSALLATVSLQGFIDYRIQLFDALIFLEVAVIFAVEALETRVTIPVSKKPSQRHRIPVATT